MAALLARRWIDAIVLVLAVAAQIEVWTSAEQTPRAVTAPGALLWTLPLLWRRRFPLGAPLLVFGAIAAETFLPGDVVVASPVNAFALIAASVLAGTHPNPRQALLAGGGGLLCMSAIVLNDAAPADTKTAVSVFLLGAGGWATGRALAEHARRAGDLERRATEIEREHDAAVLAERARIAAELHDVIAHSLSVMTIQAGAARLVLDDDPDRAREPLRAVEETGHQALGEMRRLLGILRGRDAAPGRDPQPGMAGVETLVEQVRRAGLPVRITREGPPRELPRGIDLAAFRVIQEALTNVLKHAGPAEAEVRIRYGDDGVDIAVDDNGRAAPAGDHRHDGYGLVGMRERVALYGGSFEAGPGSGGGYRVRASFPTHEALV